MIQYFSWMSKFIINRYVPLSVKIASVSRSFYYNEFYKTYC